QAQGDQDRPAIAQVNDLLRVVLGLRVRRLRRRRQGQQPCQEGTESHDARHASTSLIGLAPGSTKRMGRPTLELFCLVMSRPSAVPTVARKSGVLTAFSATVMPSGAVLP